MAVHGWDFATAAREVENILGDYQPETPKAERSEEERRGSLNKLWTSGRPIESGDPTARYLESRVGKIEFPAALRTVQKLRYHADQASFHPGMIAKLVSPAGQPVSIHRTYLTKDGNKADVSTPRRMMPGSIENGCAVRLCRYTDVLGIAEGIETAFSATKLFNIPCWAALNDYLLSVWEPPAGVKHIAIFGDHDESFAGQAAAYGLAKRLVKDGRQVEVFIPPLVGMDWNDVLKENLGKA